MMTIALEDDDDDTCAEFELDHECVRQSHMARVAVDDRQSSHNIHTYTYMRTYVCIGIICTYIRYKTM